MVDSLMVLFEADSTEFTSNGLGGLSDAVSCEVTEEINGIFELELEYPISGRRYDDLLLRRIIYTKPNPYSDPQPFRIYSVSKPIDGIVTFYANHISYDLSGYPVSPFEADNLDDLCFKLIANSATPCPFNIVSSWAATTEPFTVVVPSSIRSILGHEVLEQYGGEYEFDGFNVDLKVQRGVDRGVAIRYGKNLTDLTQEENCNNVFTAIYPFWYSDEEGLVELPAKILNAPGEYDYTRIYTLDLSQDFSAKPTVEQLGELTELYMSVLNIGVPEVSLSVAFQPLAMTEEYKDYAVLETVRLGDIVTVEFPKLKVNSTARCHKTIYNSITDKYVNIELGDYQPNLVDTLMAQGKAIADSPTRVYIKDAIDRATQLITGGLGGHVVIHSSIGEDHPNEILIMDSPDIATANRVWRWNSGGLGYSSSGYAGPYELAMTIDGAINADFITAGEINALNIKSCTIQGGSLNINDKFIVNNSGNITAEGTIKATAGQIGDCEIIDGILQVSAANITGTLIIGQLPSDVATTDDVPDSSDITTITENYIKTTNVIATNLKVKAANVEGVLVVGQLPYGTASIDDIPTKISAFDNDEGFVLDDEVTIITENYIKTTNVIATNLKVKAANVEGVLVVGQLPSSVAQQSDIPYVPSAVSELNNDAGYKDYTGVTTIIDGYVDADFINARDVVAKRLKVERDGKTIFSAIAGDGDGDGSIVISPTTLDITVSGGQSYIDFGSDLLAPAFLVGLETGVFAGVNSNYLNVHSVLGMNINSEYESINLSAPEGIYMSSNVGVTGTLSLPGFVNVATTLTQYNYRLAALEGSCGSCDNSDCIGCDSGDCTSCDTSCDTCQSEQTPDYDYYVGDTFAVYYDKSGSYYLDLDGFEVVYEDSDHDELECVREGWCSYQVMLSGDPYGALVELYIGPDPDPCDNCDAYRDEWGWVN